jgi:spore germination protein KC
MKSMTAKWTVCIMMISFLTGCWDAKELSDVGVVVAMGVDQGEKEDELKLSFQVVNPAIIAGEVTSPSTPISIVADKGYNVFEATRKASREISRELYFSHLMLVVIGEELAKEGISDLLDIVERDHEFRLTPAMFIAKNTTAEKIVSTLTPLEQLPASKILQSLKATNKKLAQSNMTEIYLAVEKISAEGSELTVPGIKVSPSTELGYKMGNLERATKFNIIKVDGLALFKGDKFSAWMEEEFAQGVVYVIGKNINPIVTFDCDGKKAGVTIETLNIKQEIKAKMKQGEPNFTIKISGEAQVGELKCAIDVGKSKELKELEKQAEETIKKDIQASLAFAQEQKSDVFGLGEALRHADPKAWKKIEKDWDILFADVTPEIDVQLTIMRTGKRIKPLHKGENGG